MTKSLTRSELNQIVRKSGTKLKNGQYMLTKPLKVFKKIYTKTIHTSYYAGYSVDCIANLIIPIGAIVNLCEIGEKKFRASVAYCHSIVEQSSQKRVASGFSGYNKSFMYYSGKKLGLTDSDFENMVVDVEKYEVNNWSWRPDVNKRIKALNKCKVTPDAFDLDTNTCSSGIHFFHELASAKSY